MSFDAKGMHGGSNSHRRVLTTVINEFERSGHTARELEQSGRSTPDGIVEPRSGPKAKTQQDKATFEDVFADKPLAIEAETSTATKPVHLLLNLSTAVNNGQQCLFAVPGTEKDEDRTRRAKQIIATIRGRSPANPSLSASDDDKIGIAQYVENGTHRYYSSERKLYVNNGTGLRPASSVPGMWFRTEDGEIVYSLAEAGEGSSETELVRFKNYEAVTEGEPEYIAAVSERTDDRFRVIEADGTEHHYGSQEMIDTEWESIYKPFIPEIAFNDPPTHRDYVVVIVEPNATAEDGATSLYRYNPEDDTTDPIHL